jgi:plastocyanin
MHSTVAVEITPIPLFSPGLIVISAGDTVKWTNNDLYIHAPVADAGNPVPGGPDAAALFPNGIPSGQSYTWVSPADVPSGTRWYYHDLYNGLAGDGVQMGSGMTGVIIVR